MSFEHSEPETTLPRGIINLQDHSSSVMDVRARKITADNHHAPPNTSAEKKKIEYNQSLSQGSTRRLLTTSHFSLASLILLMCVTASLLILPLILAPLPPPPFMLLLLPIDLQEILCIKHRNGVIIYKQGYAAIVAIDQIFGILLFSRCCLYFAISYVSDELQATRNWIKKDINWRLHLLVF